MKKQTILSGNLPNIPWEEKPENCNDVVWRYSKNPVIPRDIIPCANSVLNSAAIPFENGFAGMFHIGSKCRNMRLHTGKSKDGFNWDIEHEPIKFTRTNDDIEEFIEGYDPRVAKIDDKYYITWCNSFHGPTIGIAYTYDFKTFHQMENAFLPCNRNGVLFPRKINGKFVMLNRPSDNGHTPFGDIFLSQSPDLTFWGQHRFVMGTFGDKCNWQSTKIGPGTVPIETTEGWLIFYHGVLTSCNGFVYFMGGALLDIDKPWEVLYRTEPYLLAPQMLYEQVGDVPNVVFPCSALHDAESGKIAIYYGCADTCKGLAFCQVDELIDFIKNNSKV